MNIIDIRSVNKLVHKQTQCTRDTDMSHSACTSERDGQSILLIPLIFTYTSPATFVAAFRRLTLTFENVQAKTSCDNSKRSSKFSTRIKDSLKHSKLLQ